MQWRPPAEPNISVRREIWMPGSLAAQINALDWPLLPHEAAAKASQRRADCHALMASFLLGDDMEVGCGNARADFKALTPPQGQEWRAWELRPLPSRPLTRLFGVMVTERDFLAWHCVPKASVTPNSQNNLAKTAINQSSVVVGQTMISSKSMPTARTLGGDVFGWWDYE